MVADCWVVGHCVAMVTQAPGGRSDIKVDICQRVIFDRRSARSSGRPAGGYGRLKDC